MSDIEYCTRLNGKYIANEIPTSTTTFSTSPKSVQHRPTSRNRRLWSWFQFQYGGTNCVRALVSFSFHFHKVDKSRHNADVVYKLVSDYVHVAKCKYLVEISKWTRAEQALSMSTVDLGLGLGLCLGLVSGETRWSGSMGSRWDVWKVIIVGQPANGWKQFWDEYYQVRSTVNGCSTNCATNNQRVYDDVYSQRPTTGVTSNGSKYQHGRRPNSAMVMLDNVECEQKTLQCLQ